MWCDMIPVIIMNLLTAACYSSSTGARMYQFLSATVIVLMRLRHYWPVSTASAVQMVTDTAVTVIFPGKKTAVEQKRAWGTCSLCVLYTGGIGMMDKGTPEVTLNKVLPPDMKHFTMTAGYCTLGWQNHDKVV